MIRKFSSGGYRLYSRKADPKTGKRRNLGTFKTRAATEMQERLHPCRIYDEKIVPVPETDGAQNEVYPG